MYTLPKVHTLQLQKVAFSHSRILFLHYLCRLLASYSFPGADSPPYSFQHTSAVHGESGEVMTGPIGLYRENVLNAFDPPKFIYPLRMISRLSVAMS